MEIVGIQGQDTFTGREDCVVRNLSESNIGVPPAKYEFGYDEICAEKVEIGMEGLYR